MSSPVLSESRWEAMQREDGRPTDLMTANGTVTKTGILLLVMMATLAWAWSAFWNDGAPNFNAFKPFFLGGAIVGLIAVLIGTFVPKLAMPMGFVYALAEGLFLAGVTMMFEVRYPGLPMLAACFTTATLLSMLLLYRAGIIKASPGFVRGVIAATGGLFLGVALLMLLNVFGIGGGIRGALYGNGAIGIGFSVLCVGLAALNLVIDFDFIENGAKRGMAKRYEWLGALGLLVTLVWLYIEILRLLGKLRR
ncbi:MAG: Bax inhibitor-1/YccA family protein [Planctomycetes bacterium]|nr:Bax inhibitor-1/YccA family protein [Planctomycetota bacterium]